MKSSESEFNLNYSKIIDVSVQTTIGKKIRNYDCSYSSCSYMCATKPGSSVFYYKIVSLSCMHKTRLQLKHK